MKKDNKFHNMPQYIFNMIQGVKLQFQEIQDVVFKNLKFNAFALLPENMVYAMTQSEEMQVREQGIQRILSIRRGKQKAHRLNRIPTINIDAMHWYELIDINQPGVCEPALTKEFTDDDLTLASQTGSTLKTRVACSLTECGACGQTDSGSRSQRVWSGSKTQAHTNEGI